MTEPTNEQIQDAIANDKRFAAIDLGVSLASELRDSRALSVFLSALAQEAQDALVEFADVNIANPQAIIPLQVRVRAVVFLNRTIEEVLNTARAAEAHVMAETRGNTNEYPD